LPGVFTAPKRKDLFHFVHSWFVIIKR
jgi:hypothetical protein